MTFPLFHRPGTVVFLDDDPDYLEMLALVLLGISGAWIAHLTALDPWRPWFIAATLLCLGLAFWTLYGPSSHCRTEGVCIDPAILRRRRFWLWTATVLITLLLLFPYLIGWFL